MVRRLVGTTPQFSFESLWGKHVRGQGVVLALADPDTPTTALHFGPEFVNEFGNPLRPALFFGILDPFHTECPMPGIDQSDWASAGRIHGVGGRYRPQGGISSVQELVGWWKVTTESSRGCGRRWLVLRMKPIHCYPKMVCIVVQCNGESVRTEGLLIIGPQFHRSIKQQKRWRWRWHSHPSSGCQGRLQGQGCCPPTVRHLWRRHK